MKLSYKIFSGLFLLVLVAGLLVWSYSSKKTSYPELQDVKKHSQSFSELKKYFEDLANQKSPEYAFEVLKTADLPPNTDFHLLGHAIGDVLYKKEGLKGIYKCTQDFRNACSHSIVVGLFFDKGESALDAISDACRHAPGGSGAYTMCFHGLGHGILAYLDYDLKKTVEMCQKTGTPEYNYQEYPQCVGGSIMEMISGGFHDKIAWGRQRKIYFTKNDALTPCDTDLIPSGAKLMCYTYLTPYLFEFAGADINHPGPADFSKAFQYCSKLPLSDPNRNICYGGFGKEFIVLAQNRDIRNVADMTTEQFQKVYAWCLLANDKNGTQACIENSTASLYWGGENKPDGAIRFCNSISDQVYQYPCFEDLFGMVSYYIKDPGYYKSFCSTVPEIHKAECKKVLRVG